MTHSTELLNLSLNLSLTTSSPSNYTMDFRCFAYDKDLPPNQDRTFISISRTCLILDLIFFVMGLVGNTLSVIVFGSKEMRVQSSNIYLLVLAISDTLYLVSMIPAHALNGVRCLFAPESDLDINNSNDFFCQTFQFLVDLFADYSTCLILCFTIERLIAVYFPTRFKEICTVRRAKIICMLVLLVIVVFVAPYHYVYMSIMEGYAICVPTDNDLFGTLYIVEAVLFRVLPVCVIAVLNICIIVKVTKLTRAQRRLTGGGVKSNGNARSQRRDDRHLQLTIMLISVSTSYIIVFIPVIVHFVLQKLDYRYEDPKDSPFSEFAMLATQNITRTLYVFGFAINFFLYTMSGRVFREQLIQVLCSKNKNPKVNGGYTSCKTVDTTQF